MKGEVFMHGCYMILCDGNNKFLPGKVGGWGELLKSGITQQAANGSWVACD